MGHFASLQTSMASNSEDNDEVPNSGEVEEVMEVVDPENSDMEESEGEEKERRVYLPGDPLDEGEMLVRDDSAYHMYHQAQTGMRNSLCSVETYFSRFHE